MKSANPQQYDLPHCKKDHSNNSQDGLGESLHTLRYTNFKVLTNSFSNEMEPTEKN